jgi:hypothetical protein
MTEEERTRVALWRLSVLGSLISAHLEHGDRAEHFREAAKLTYALPDGRRVTLSSRTIESWFHAWRKEGLEGLKPGIRIDSGRSRAIGPDLADWVIRAKREKPRRSIRRIIRMLERAGVARVGELTKSSVHRLLETRSLSARPSRLGDKERRAFRHRAPGDLWMGDVMHSRPVVVPEGKLKKSYLHVFIDSATRFLPHAAFRLGEKAHDFEAVLKQALMKHGRPRALYVDRGAAQISLSLALICGELDIRLIHCEAQDAPAKGAVERVIRTCREEIEDEFPEEPLSLSETNSLLWSWMAAEYHRRQHEGTGRVPLEHWLEGAHEIRPLPHGVSLDELFLHRERREVRKDGTIKWEGKLLEVRSELSGRTVELRFDPEQKEKEETGEAKGAPKNLPRVFVDGRFVCDTVLLDPIRNSFRPRRRRRGEPDPQASPTGLDPLALIREQHLERVRPPGPDHPGPSSRNPNS